MGNLIVTVLGGWFGLHKFIQGNVKMGIIYLLTGGLFGFGWIFDSIVALIKIFETPKTPRTHKNTQKAQHIYNFEIAGMNYYTDQIEFIMDRNYRNAEYVYRIKEAEVRLVPEPTNKYDKNAIKVMMDGTKIGYVPAILTKDVKPLINKKTFVGTIRGGSKRVDGSIVEASFRGFVNIV